LDPSAARKLARALPERHAIFRHGLLTPASRAAATHGVRLWRAAERFASYLAGVDETDAEIVANGGPLLPAQSVAMTEHQRTIVKLLEQTFGSDASSIVLLE